MVKRFFLNVGIISVSLLAVALFLELIVFRYWFPAAQLPRLADTNPGQVLKFQPQQEGIYRVKNEIAANFRINKQGWNSGHESYQHVREKDNLLAAIIGDSYIEALQVDYDQSMAERLETLTDSSLTVYRFGVSGAPLSQYLHMYQNEVRPYKPDYVVFLLIHNDFKESIVGTQIGLYTASFAKWQTNIDGTIGAMRSPSPYKAGIATIVRSTNIYGFLVVRMRVNVTNLKRRVLTWLQDDSVKTNTHIANIEIFDLNTELLTNIADKFFATLASLEKSDDVQFIAIMDGPRGLDAEGCRRKGHAGIRRMNNLVSTISDKHKIEFLDLTPSFLEAACKNKQGLRFTTDGHWNKTAHDVAAAALKRKYF